jgi:hypothetical protein
METCGEAIDMKISRCNLARQEHFKCEQEHDRSQGGIMVFEHWEII